MSLCCSAAGRRTQRTMRKYVSVTSFRFPPALIGVVLVCLCCVCVAMPLRSCRCLYFLFSSQVLNRGSSLTTKRPSGAIMEVQWTAAELKQCWRKHLCGTSIFNTDFKICKRISKMPLHIYLNSHRCMHLFTDLNTCMNLNAFAHLSTRLWILLHMCKSYHAHKDWDTDTQLSTHLHKW